MDPDPQLYHVILSCKSAILPVTSILILFGLPPTGWVPAESSHANSGDEAKRTLLLKDHPSVEGEGVV